jgi:hypothetical protein
VASAAFAPGAAAAPAAPPGEVTLGQLLRTAAATAVETGTRVRLAFEVDPPHG